MITDHPNYGEINSLKNIYLAAIKDAEKDYFKENDTHFQGLLIPSQRECDGTEYDGEVDYGLHPEDQTDSWGSFMPEYFNSETRLPFNIRVDIYDDGTKKGYIVAFSFRVEGYGPDLYGTSGSLWKFQHDAGNSNIGGVFDQWYIEPDPLPGE